MAAARKAAAPVAQHLDPAPRVAPHMAPGQLPSGAVAFGRDGKPIFLNQITLDQSDPFGNAQAYAPPGWVYEWKRHTIYNQEDAQYAAFLAQRHWTPVLSERHDGIFLPHGKTGTIIQGGQMLMECPEAVYRHYQAMDRERAHEKIRTAKMQHGIQARMGADTQTRAAQQNSFVRTQRDTGEDIPRPAYNYDPQTID